MQTLFKIEEEYVSTALYNLKITGYSDEEVAYHCKLLFENELISDYKDIYADNRLYSFGVGSLTWEGHDFIDKIREDTVWNRTKEVIKEKMLPTTIDVIKDISGVIIMSMIERAIKTI
ncbi:MULTISPECIES: DUF2513 domain-containing protein [unclassified Parvimonas]|uniref:DUF2513 domain-containing protein n=1 Tax=unclassified Parvimonas TaxID=1151464 RepID=UPI002B45C672|nr:MULTISPECIES: DUF2513 domain-containing protein [unclassified Parvimonas]MEB3025568.1 DUF2513 domain-containing protein [Parvimonas sp. M13]MEB3089679.1 DUF2513 domain-containing protein [Parvimonas sp. M20]